MISSDLVIRKNPILVIDESYVIPDEIANRVSFKTCAKLFVDTLANTFTDGNHIIVMTEFSMGLLNKIADTDCTNLLAVYVINGLPNNLSINKKIPVIGSDYAKSRGITDPKTQLREFISIIATDLGHTHILVPWENPDGTKESHWRVLSYGAETVQYTNKYLQLSFPYSVWISSIVKKKDYGQRKNDIISLNNMISSTQPYVDEIVLFGDDDFLTTERFPSSKTGGSKVTYVIRKNKQPIKALGDMFDYAWTHSPKQSVVCITRGDITLRNTKISSFFSRLPNNFFGMLNPLTIPDVPDPKPELFQRGVPEAAYGCIYRTKKRPIAKDSILNKIHSHMMYSFGIAAELARQRNIMITNPSATFQTWVPTGSSPTFIKADLAGIPQARVAVGKSIYASLNESRTPIWEPVLDEDTTTDIQISPITSIPGCTETKTLVNMTNKYTARKGGDKWLLDITKSRANTVGKVSPFYDAADCLFYKDYWIHIPSITGSLYNGSGIINKYGHLVTKSSDAYDGILLGAPDTRITTTIGLLSYVYNYIQSDSTVKIQPINIITQSVEDDKSDILTKMFDKLNVPFKFIHLTDGYIKGTKGNITHCINHNLNFLGYDPRMIRIFNRTFHSSYAPDAIEDVLDEISPSRASSKDAQNTAVLVGASKWRKCIQTELEQYTNIRIIPSETATRDDYVHASYIIGTSESDDWAFTTFVNADKCRVIEIAPEYDCDVKWFHLASTSVGCEHMYLSLKQEPSKQCKKRIKTHIMAYIREEDKVSSDEQNVVTSV